MTSSICLASVIVAFLLSSSLLLSPRLLLMYYFYLVAMLDTYNERGPLQCVLILYSAAQSLNKLLWPCV